MAWNFSCIQVSFLQTTYICSKRRGKNTLLNINIYIYIYIYIYLYTLFGLWMFVTSTECSTLRVNISCLKKRSLNTTKVSYRFISIYLSTYIYQVLASHAGDSLCPRSHPRKWRKRRLRRAIKSPPKGKAAWADIACAKF